MVFTDRKQKLKIDGLAKIMLDMLIAYNNL